MESLSYYNLFGGIDPGLRGGAAIVSNSGDLVAAIRLPVIIRGNKKVIHSVAFKEFFKYFTENLVVCVVEEVQVTSRQGSASGFTLGLNYGVILSILEVLEIAVETVLPLIWKKAILGESTPDRQKSLNYANSVPLIKNYAYPKEDVNNYDGVAEAVCLARYARKFYRGASRG